MAHQRLGELKQGRMLNQSSWYMWWVVREFVVLSIVLHPSNQATSNVENDKWAKYMEAYSRAWPYLYKVWARNKEVVSRMRRSGSSARFRYRTWRRPGGRSAIEERPITTCRAYGRTAQYMYSTPAGQFTGSMCVNYGTTKRMQVVRRLTSVNWIYSIGIVDTEVVGGAF
jgi:hypothetical protein